MSRPIARAGAGLTPAKRAARKVVMVTSPGAESTLVDVVINLATISAEIGQRVVIVGTEGLAAPSDGSELPLATNTRWKELTSSGNGAEHPTEDMEARLKVGSLDPADVEDLLGDTGVPGVSRLDLRYFVSHPAQVVIRAPEVLAALKKIVDVVILEVPSFLSVHHGEGLTPLADAVLVVGERRTTKLNDVRRTRTALTRLGAPVVGMALTRAREREDSYVWGRDSELELADEELNETYDTERLPTVKRSDVGSAMPHETGAVADLATPEA